MLLAPVPPVLVTCGTPDAPNALTVGWTGVLCTHPPLTYISLRPSRYSYDIIRQAGCFVINLPTTALCKAIDFCGVRSGKDTDKLATCGLHPLAAKRVTAPLLAECPVALECRVIEVRPLGTHDMFLAEIVGVDADEQYLDAAGRLALDRCGLLAYAHGEYFALGEKLGSFGFSVRRKKPVARPRKKKQ